MKNISLFIPLLFCSLLYANSVKVSKDSLWICNDILSSKDDAVIFYSTIPVKLDSLHIQFSVLDTTGISTFLINSKMAMAVAERRLSDSATMAFREFPLLKTSELSFRADIASGVPPLLDLQLTSDSISLSRLQFGFCFMCSSYPRYPKYMRGKLILFFSNQETVTINIYSNDLRTVSLHTSKNRMIPQVSSGPVYRYLLDGRMLTDNDFNTTKAKKIHRIITHRTPR